VRNIGTAVCTCYRNATRVDDTELTSAADLLANHADQGVT
jgi:hypothetical protein